MKIAYIIDSLGSKGGAERILSEKMNYLATHYGYDVHVITCYQDPRITPNAYFLSEKIKQVNLCIPYYTQYKYKYPKRLWVKNSIYRKLLKKLRETILQIDPDILIGLGYFRADTVCNIKCRAAKIIESHQSRTFTLTSQGLDRSFFTKAYMNVFRRLYFRTIEKKADVVVTLTDGDAQLWKKAKRVMVIPNFTNLPVIKHSTVSSKRVIAVGRLEWEKGFDRLIRAWQNISMKHPDWKLDIFGSGTLKEQLENLINQLCLSDKIKIHPFTSDISREYSESSIFVCTSHFEGFSLVIIEAMQFGVPSVAFDCPHGPRYIIKDGECGYLIENGNGELLAQKISYLIENPEIRKDFSRSSLEQVKKYRIDIVMDRWKELFESLTHR